MDVSRVSGVRNRSAQCSLYVGSFFPWTWYHSELLQAFEKKSRFEPVICLLYPPPFVLLRRANGDVELPHIEGLEQLLDRITRQFGLSALLCRMTTADLEASPGDFFALLDNFCSVRELLLRQNQTIGRGKEGSLAGLQGRFEGSSCTVGLLPKVTERFHRTEVFDALRKGNISRFYEATGYHPTLDQKVQRLPQWPDGKYVGRYQKDGSVISFLLRNGVPEFRQRLKSGHGPLSVIQGPRDFETEGVIK